MLRSGIEVLSGVPCRQTEMANMQLGKASAKFANFQYDVACPSCFSVSLAIYVFPGFQVKNGNLKYSHATVSALPCFQQLTGTACRIEHEALRFNTACIHSVQLCAKHTQLFGINLESSPWPWTQVFLGAYTPDGKQDSTRLRELRQGPVFVERNKPNLP